MSGVEEGRTAGGITEQPAGEWRKPQDQDYGKCPVEMQLTEDAVSRTVANEFLCAEEYGEEVGDPEVGWWSVNWVNTPAMAPGPFESELDEELAPPPSK